MAVMMAPAPVEPLKDAVEHKVAQEDHCGDRDGPQEDVLDHDSTQHSQKQESAQAPSGHR